jgi:hypothetical protein
MAAVGQFFNPLQHRPRQGTSPTLSAAQRVRSRAVQVLAAILPHPAGLILAGAATAVLCCGYHMLATRIRGEEMEWEMLAGGAIVAGALGVIGMALVLAGAPAFK